MWIGSVKDDDWLITKTRLTEIWVTAQPGVIPRLSFAGGQGEARMESEHV